MVKWASAMAWSTADFTQHGQPLGSGICGAFGLASIMTSENEFCKNSTLKDTINAMDSESYDSIGGHKHSLDQDTRTVEPPEMGNVVAFPHVGGLHHRYGRIAA
jgi:hypothetical protein